MTEDTPKCLLRLNAMSVLEWQVRQLHRFGVTDITVVTGFQSEKVEAVLMRLRAAGIQVRGLFNPFYKVADNLASCWLARDEMEGDLIVLNGDTVFENRVLERLLENAGHDINVTVDRKERYDADDMKVQLDGNRLTRVGKDLPLDKVDGESIGMILFRPEGTQAFRNALEDAMRTPEGVKSWYLKVIDRLARDSAVHAVSIYGREWAEIDYPVDIKNARRLARGWMLEDAAADGVGDDAFSAGA